MSKETGKDLSENGRYLECKNQCLHIKIHRIDKPTNEQQRKRKYKKEPNKQVNNNLVHPTRTRTSSFGQVT